MYSNVSIERTYFHLNGIFCLGKYRNVGTGRRLEFINMLVSPGKELLQSCGA